jgi:hypothetical protein
MLLAILFPFLIGYKSTKGRFFLSLAVGKFLHIKSVGERGL